MKDLIILSMFKDSQEWHKRKIYQLYTFRKNIHRAIRHVPDLDIECYFLLGKSSDSTEQEAEKVFNQEPGITEYNLCMHFTGSGEPHISFKNFACKANLICEPTPFTKRVESVDMNSRLKGLSAAANYLLSAARGKAKNYLWIESDLIFDQNLIEDLYFAQYYFDIAAPMIIMKNKDMFYDTWGFRYLNGNRVDENFHKSPLTNLVDAPEGYEMMRSIGSCALIRGELINNFLDFGTYGFPYLCDKAAAHGARVGVDRECIVYHPDNEFVHNRWI